MCAKAVYSLDHDVGVIWEDSEGELWTNQTGGPCCHHPETRGRFEHIHNTPFENGYCLCGRHNCAEENLDFIFLKHNLPFTVDRNRMLEEGWIPVISTDGKRGIFVYGNCD